MTTPTLPTAKTGLARIIAAAGYSWAGLRYAWREEAAVRQECALLLLGIPLALYLGQSGLERAVLVAVLLLVLLVELLNSAIEALVDLASPGFHPLAKAAKDIGSAAVLIALLIAGTTWALLLVPRWMP
jgi:diacylglycerol kinase (ATP)